MQQEHCLRTFTFIVTQRFRHAGFYFHYSLGGVVTLLSNVKCKTAMVLNLSTPRPPFV